MLTFITSTKRKTMNHYRTSLLVGILLGMQSLALSCGRSELSQEDLASFDKAQTLYTERKFDEARDLLMPLSEKYGDSPEVAVLLARIYFFTREFQKSESTLRELIGKRDSPYASLWLGRVIASDPKRQEEAAEIFRSVLREDPENHAAHYYLGRCLENQGKIQEALLSYQRALAVEYQLSKIHLHMGTMFHSMKMEDRASKHFKRVEQLNLYPEDIASIHAPREDRKNTRSNRND